MSTADREPNDVRQLVEDASAMAWAHDAAGTLLHANAAWRAAVPAEATTLPQAWLKLMPPYDLVRRLDAFGAALRAGAPYAFEHRLAARPDDEWYLTEAVPVRAGGSLVWFGTTVARPAPVRARAEPAGSEAPALPRLPGLRLAAAAGPAGRAGGGWYDAFGLPDGRLALAVGRIEPAAGSAAEPRADPAGRARAAIRGAILAGGAPHTVLAAADAALTRAKPGRTASALVALYDPRTGLLDHARAGHPPALLRQPGAEAVALAAVPRPPLGRPARAAAELRTALLQPGAELLLHAGDPGCDPAADPAGAWVRLRATAVGGASEAVILLLTRELDGPGRAW